MSNLAKWVRFRAACYLTGRGLTYGASDVFNPPATAPGKYSVNVSPIPSQFVDVCDEGLEVFEDGAFDHVFVGRHLEVGKPGTLKELGRKLKIGGHLIVHLPVNGEGNYIHEQYTPESFVGLIGEVGRWQAKGSYEEGGYFVQVYKKLDGKRGVLGAKPRSTKPRACIVRYGALGDMVMITPLIKKLHEDGYEITMNITPYAWPVIERNPYVDNFLIQEREIIPNHDLGAYWDLWRGEYDKYINLSESIEGSLLKVEGRSNFFTRQSWRHNTCNRNYYDYTMKLGGYEVEGAKGELHFTNAEERRAKQFRDGNPGFLVMWALNGSSHHKVYPLMEPVMTEWLAEHPDAKLLTVGDYTAKLLEFKHPRVIPKAGEWTLRESMLMTKYVDCVVGPETAMLNAAGCYPTPKITLLSHSSHENLCKHWEGDYCLEPDKSFAPCYPCHQLHYTSESCPLGQILSPDGKPLATGPVCAMGAISGDRLKARLDEVYARWKNG